MAAVIADLDELADLLNADVEIDGEAVRRTLFTRVREGRGWATVMIGFEERASDLSWRPKLTVLRLRRAGEGWKKHAQITLPADHVRVLARELGVHAAAFADEALDGDGDEADAADASA